MRRWILGTGSALIVGILLLAGVYEWKDNRNQAVPVKNMEEPQVTLEGYEDEGDLIGYLLYHLRAGRMDLALRVCSFDNISRFFSMETYTGYGGSFEGTSTIPPSDTDSAAYQAITNARLTSFYVSALEQLAEQLGRGAEVEYLGIEDGTPEDADGLYYQRKTKICEILGARSLEERTVYLRIDGESVELRCTLIRYKKYWEVLYFHSLEEEGLESVDLRKSTEMGRTELPLEGYGKDVLPCNYYLLNDCSEEDPQQLLEQFFLCLQREDALSAAAYYDLGMEPEVSSELFLRQSQAAQEVQVFYYQLFLNDTDYFQWIMRDLDDRGPELVKTLSTTNMLYSSLVKVEEYYNDGQYAEYGLICSYDGTWFGFKCILENRNGWKIESVTRAW